MNIVFFGSSSYVIPILEVIQKNFNLCLVITTEKSQTQPIPKYCIENKIPYLSVQQFNNSTIEQLRNLKSQAAVLADFGLIIPKEILNLFPKGIINIHPSLLPKYRGPTPVQTAILNGETKTGITIIKLDEEVDHGPILTQVEEPIFENDTSESLYERLFRVSASLIIQTIEPYLSGKIKLYKQNHKEATFTKTLKREDGFIDINNPRPTAQDAVVTGGPPSPEKLQRMIRAYFPWPGVFTKLKINNKELRIKLLPDNKLQVEGKKPVSYKDFLNGYPQLKNIKLIKQLLTVEKP